MGGAEEGWAKSAAEQTARQVVGADKGVGAHGQGGLQSRGEAPLGKAGGMVAVEAECGCGGGM